MTTLDQRPDHYGGTADIVNILSCVLATGAQISDQRCASEHLADVIQREGYAGLVGERRQMQRGVGRPTGRGDNGGAVFK